MGTNITDGFRTIATRIRNTKTELDDLGEVVTVSIDFASLPSISVIREDGITDVCIDGILQKRRIDFVPLSNSSEKDNQLEEDSEILDEFLRQFERK